MRVWRTVMATVGLGVVAAARWFPTNPNLPYFGNDTIYPLSPRMDAGLLFSMWDPAQLGQPSLYPALIPYLGFFAAARSVGLNLGISQHLYEWLAAFLGALAAAALSSASVPRPKWRSAAWLLGGCVYLLVPSAVYLPTGWWATVAIPLMIWAAKRAIAAKSLSIAARWGVLGACGSLLLLNDIPNYQLQIVLLIWVVVCTTVMISTVGRAAAQELLTRTIFYWSAAVGLLAPLLASIVWMLLPSYSASVRITSALVGADRTYGDYGHTTLGPVLTLMSYYPLVWQDQAVRILSVLLPSCAIFAAVRYWRDSWIRGVAVATMVAVAITVGPNPPTGPMYQWFMEHVPGSLAFRTVGKIHLFIAVGYAILAPVGVLEISRLLGRFLPQGSSLRRYAFYGVPVLFLGALAFVAWPLLDGQAFRTPISATTQPRIIPPIYRRVGKYLSSQRGQTLIYPDQGYTEEPLENGMYFGPSLTTFAFPRNVLYSGTGAYGSPAPPKVRNLYNSIDNVVLAPPALLIGGNLTARVVVDSAPGDKVFRANAILRIIPARGRSRDAVVLHFPFPLQVAQGNENLIVQLGGSSTRDAAISVDGHALGLIADPGHEATVPLDLPNLSPGNELEITIAYKIAANDPRSVNGANLSILRIGFIKKLPKSLLENMRQQGIQYLFFDGASDNPRVPLFELAMAHDRSISTIMSDSHGRRLLLIHGKSHAAFAFSFGNLVPIKAWPQHKFGRMWIGFDAQHSRALVLKQNYSPLWSYSVSVDGGQPHMATAGRWNGWATMVMLPPGHSYVVRGFYAPQLLLEMQYIIFGAVMLLACVWAGARVLKYVAHPRGRGGLM